NAVPPEGLSTHRNAFRPSLAFLKAGSICTARRNAVRAFSRSPPPCRLDPSRTAHSPIGGSRQHLPSAALLLLYSRPSWPSDTQCIQRLRGYPTRNLLIEILDICISLRQGPCVP